jgi:hypothetical protein
MDILTYPERLSSQMLYRWQVQGWVLGKVVRVSRAAGFSHGVRYARGSALGLAEAASLLELPCMARGLRTGGCCAALSSFQVGFSGTTVMDREQACLVKGPGRQE